MSEYLHVPCTEQALDINRQELVDSIQETLPVARGLATTPVVKDKIRRFFAKKWRLPIG